MPLIDATTITGKGTTLKASIAFVDAHYGREGVDKLAAALGPEERQLVKGLLLPGGKYPLPQLVSVYETIDRVFGKGDFNLCWEVGKFAGDFEVRMLHKVFLQVAQLEYWLKIAGVSWRFYYSHGKLSADISGTTGDVRLTEFNPISKAFCYRFGGWVHRIIELSRKNNVTVRHPECILDGKPACIWHGTWTK